MREEKEARAGIYHPIRSVSLHLTGGTMSESQVDCISQVAKPHRHAPKLAQILGESINPSPLIYIILKRCTPQ